MHPLDIDTALGWRGKTVLDEEGEKIGTLGEIYLDEETDRPAWGGVRTGLFGSQESYIPLAAVSLADGDLQVPYAKQVVKDAPRIHPDVALSAAEEQTLHEHYGQDYGRIERGPEEPAGGDPEPAGADPDATAAPARAGDPAEGGMIRHEEEIVLSPGEPRPVERVRLRKVRVTDHVERTVPVRKEVIQLETDPSPEGRIESVEDVEDDTPAGERRLDDARPVEGERSLDDARPVEGERSVDDARPVEGERRS